MAGRSGRRSIRLGRAEETSVFLTTARRRSAAPPRAAIAPGAPPAELVYQLRVALRDVTPLVWRRLQVTGDTTVARLHANVQTAMGWEDLHLHQFRIHGKRYGVSEAGGVWFDDDPHQVRLCDFRLRPGERFVYEYDFGDLWQHDLRLERVLPRDPARRYPVCTAGAGDCPPEDCGGPPGDAALLAAAYSWPAWEQARADAAFVAQRLLDWYRGGPRPTYDDEEFVDAFERMRERLAALPQYLHPEAEHLLDWFHLTMRLTVLQQCAHGLPPSPANAAADEEPLERRLESAEHSLWHGNSAMALDRLEEVDPALTQWGCDEAGEPLPGVERAAAARMRKYVHDLVVYISNNAASIVNYGDRYRNGERISTAFTESTINQVVSKRMVKKQQRQWTPVGAHLLLQVRTQVRNDEWEAAFRSWYPGFRPAPPAADSAA